MSRKDHQERRPTDSVGLVEAHNPSREMFGFPRLQKLLEEQADEASLIDVLLGELKRFTGEGWEQEDDITLVTLQGTPLSLTCIKEDHDCSPERDNTRSPGA